MGFADEPFGWDDETFLARGAAALQAGGEAVDGAALAAGRWVRPAPEGLPVQLGNVFPATPDGRIRLAPAELGSERFVWLPPEGGQGPLALISPADPRRISSSLGELGRQDLAVTLHPADAADRGIAAGDRVRVFNELGEVVCRARVSRRLRPGVARLPKGAWQRHSENGETATALCPPTLGFAGGACFNDARVEVERLGG
jgi:anaerobic selenocysteine-containing dehydrogenase